MWTRKCQKENKKPTMMNLPGELRLYVINGGALLVTSITNLEHWLKLTLLVVTIGYTVTKWVLALLAKKEKKKEEEKED